MDSQAASRDALVHVARVSLGTAPLRSEETAAQLTFQTLRLRVTSVCLISFKEKQVGAPTVPSAVIRGSN
jgi:hypothetical protein